MAAAAVAVVACYPEVLPPWRGLSPPWSAGGPGVRRRAHLETALIFTQGQGIKLSAASLGHQPRLEQAGKAAGWHDMAGSGATAAATADCSPRAAPPPGPKSWAPVFLLVINWPQNISEIKSFIKIPVLENINSNGDRSRFVCGVV